MNTYFIEFDGINGACEMYYSTNNYKHLFQWVETILKELGGGHADIYDEDGDFVEDLEI